MAVTESALEAKKERVAQSMQSNEEKIAALNEQCDQKVKDIQEKRKKEIESVKAKFKEQTDALKDKNKDLQKQWDEFEAERVKVHGKNVGDLFNQFVSDDVNVDLVAEFLKSKGGEFESFLKQMETGEESSNTEEPEEKSDEPEPEEEPSADNGYSGYGY